MFEREREDAENGIKRMLVAADKEKRRPAPPLTKRNPLGASTAPGVMKHIAVGSGAASQRSGKGGKSGGGMGGQQAGGMKGGCNRKTHAGRK